MREPDLLMYFLECLDKAPCKWWDSVHREAIEVSEGDVVVLHSEEDVKFFIDAGRGRLLEQEEVERLVAEQNGEGTADDDLAELSPKSRKDDLLAVALDRGVEGADKMTKDELVKALWPEESE